MQDFCTPDMNRSTRLYHISCIITLYFTLYYTFLEHLWTFNMEYLGSFSLFWVLICSLKYDIIKAIFCVESACIHLKQKWKIYIICCVCLSLITIHVL